MFSFTSSCKNKIEKFLVEVEFVPGRHIGCVLADSSRSADAGFLTMPASEILLRPLSDRGLLLCV